MTTNTLQERKQYIKDIKASFADPAHSARYSDFSSSGASSAKEETPATFKYFRIRLLIAILLFAAFVYVDKSGLQWKDYNAETVREQIEKSFPLEKLLQKIS